MASNREIPQESFSGNNNDLIMTEENTLKKNHDDIEQLETNFDTLLEKLKVNIRATPWNQRINLLPFSNANKVQQESYCDLEKVFNQIKTSFKEIFKILEHYSYFHQNPSIYIDYIKDLHNLLFQLCEKTQLITNSEKKHGSESQLIEACSTPSLNFYQQLKETLLAWNKAFQTDMFSRKKSWFELDGPKTYPFYFTLSIAASALVAIAIGTLFAAPVVGAIVGTVLGLYVYTEVQIKAIKKQDADMNAAKNCMNSKINKIIRVSIPFKNISLFKNTSTPKKSPQNKASVHRAITLNTITNN